ncbi:transcriptional regulator [Philodulcilactobacillus myokoensis]|uniref:Transcriptional regulator n=1 Tax=Philodulcilactobacillus myokoensis TaxID=2929573 RepID=A0A9W6ES96_9LACO|nr:helix-turn-helix transcriptional regulator [Philodulcilactobacillus myokoensis]GLB46133.1 transcriptional regulator [Philodulcilactobacillus myokoensis]
MNFSDKLKFLRKQNQFTQKNLADQLHVSRKTVSSWESGRNYPDIKTIVKISTIYDIPIDRLLKDNNIVNYYDDKIHKGKTHEKLQKIFFYLTSIIIFFGYIELYEPDGFHIPLIGGLVIINAIIINIFVLRQHFFQNKNTTITLLLLFTIILIFNVIFGIPKKFLDILLTNRNNDDFILGSISGRLLFILSITICTTIEIVWIYLKYQFIKNRRLKK